jgi:hypothetical protein
MLPILDPRIITAIFLVEIHDRHGISGFCQLLWKSEGLDVGLSQMLRPDEHQDPCFWNISCQSIQGATPVAFADSVNARA